jgi:hypothetical protein
MELYKIILGIQAISLVVVMIILIWLVFRRISKKKDETFEKRRN